jgi:hypothetical protein
MPALDKKSCDVLEDELVRGILDINSLNLAKESQRQAFLAAIERRPALLAQVSALNEEHFLPFAIDHNYEWFVHLKKEQYSDKIAQIYLYNRLTASEQSQKKKFDTAAECMEFIVQKSMDDKILLTCLYTTPEGDEICYNDTKLGVPLALKSSVKFTFKINDAVKLINKIDMCVEYLGEIKIKSLLAELVSCYYAQFLTEYISKNNAGYYDLRTSYAAIEAGAKDHLSNVFADYGIVVSNIIVKKLAIPTDIQHKIEDQAFVIRQRKAEIEADAELAKISLQNYEAKLEVQKKYPDTEHSLTEYEKDLALKRYLIKNGREEKEEIDHTINIKKIHEQSDKQIAKIADIIPEIVQKANVFKRTFYTLLCLSLLIFFILLATESIGGAFILLGFISLIFGTIAAFCHERLKNAPIEPETEKTDAGGKIVE